MASIFGHGLVAYTMAKVIDNKHLKTLLCLAIFSAILPDADVVAFKLGIAYEHPLGHRGFSHAVLFAILWAGTLSFWLGKSNKVVYFVVLFLSTISHGLLDALTNGGKGVGFFIPLNNERYFFPWRPIKVSPLGIKEFFSEWGLNVILSEIKYIALPCLIILVISAIASKTNTFPRN